MFTGIIGGADGPTKIYLAGALTDDGILLIAAIVIAVLFLAAAGTRIYKMVKKHRLEKMEKMKSESPEEEPVEPEGADESTEEEGTEE